MSNDLVKRLRAAAKHPMMDNNCKADVFDVADAADRIEELEGQLQSVLDRETSILRYYDAKLDAAEAKLVKAVEFTKGVIRHAGNSGDDYLAEQARTTLAELKGQDDEDYQHAG